MFNFPYKLKDWVPSLYNPKSHTLHHAVRSFIGLAYSNVLANKEIKIKETEIIWKTEKFITKMKMYSNT